MDQELLRYLIDQAGGGLAGLVIAGLSWLCFDMRRRNDKLVDKILDMSAATTSALNELTRTIERGGR